MPARFVLPPAETLYAGLRPGDFCIANHNGARLLMIVLDGAQERLVGVLHDPGGVISGPVPGVYNEEAFRLRRSSVYALVDAEISVLPAAGEALALPSGNLAAGAIWVSDQGTPCICLESNRSVFRYELETGRLMQPAEGTGRIYPNWRLTVPGSGPEDDRLEVIRR